MGRTFTEKDAALDQEGTTQNNRDMNKEQDHLELAAGKCDNVVGEEFIDSKELNKLRIDGDEKLLDRHEAYVGQASVAVIAEDSADHSHALENSHSLKTVCSVKHSDAPSIERKLTETDVTMERNDACSRIKSTLSCESPTSVKAHGYEYGGNANNLEVSKGLSQVEGRGTNVACQSGENFRKYLMDHNLMSLHNNDTERHDRTLSVPVTNQKDAQVVVLEEGTIDGLEGDTDLLSSAGTGVEAIFDHHDSESSTYSEGIETQSNIEVDAIEDSKADIGCSEDEKVAGETAFNKGLERLDSQHNSFIQRDNYVAVSGESKSISLKDHRTAYNQNSFSTDNANGIPSNSPDHKLNSHVENISVPADTLEEDERHGENLTNSDMCSENFHLSRSTIDSSTGAICSESLQHSDLQASSSEAHILSNGCSGEIIESQGERSVDAHDFSACSDEQCSALEEEICKDGSSKNDFADCSLTEVNAGEICRKTDNKDLVKVDHKDISEQLFVETEHEEEGSAIPENIHYSAISSQFSTVLEPGVPLAELEENTKVHCLPSHNSSLPAPETSISFKKINALPAKTRLGTRESYYSSLPLIDVEDDIVYGDFLASEDDSGLCHSELESQNESVDDSVGNIDAHSQSVGLGAKEDRKGVSLTALTLTRKPNTTNEQSEASRSRSAVVTSMPVFNSFVSEKSLEGAPPLHHVPKGLQQGSKDVETSPDSLQTVSHTPDNLLPSTTENFHSSLENSQGNLASHEQQSLGSSWESYGSVNKGMVITHSFEESHENNEECSLEKEENNSDSKLPISSETAAYITAIDQMFSPSPQMKSELASYHTAVETMNNTVSFVGSQDSPKRCFNDTIEEMEMLLKYGIDYEEKMLNANEGDGQKMGNLDDTDDDPIVSPLRKTSVCSTVSNVSFKPMMDSTRASSYKEELEKPRIFVHNDEVKPVKIYSPESEAMSVCETGKILSKEAYVINTETHKQSGEEKHNVEHRVPPPKPPRLKGAEPMTPIQVENDKDRGSSCNSAQRSRSPTSKLNKMTTKDHYSHEQGSVKRNQTTPTVTPVRTKALMSNLAPKKSPSSNTVTSCRGTKTLGSDRLPEVFLTPQCKIPQTVTNIGSEGRLQHRKRLNLGKKQGLSIVSPVARYLKENPPPPLVRNVKPKHKISPLKMNSEICRPTNGSGGNTCIPAYSASQQESQSHTSNPENGREAQRKTSMDVRQAALDKICHNMAKLHDKIEEVQQANKSRHGKGTTSVLPVCSYSAATPVQYDDEKENRRIRRDILGEKPAKRVVRHKGRMQLPKVNFIEGLESSSPNSSPAVIKTPEVSAARTSSEKGSFVEVSLCEPHRVRHTNTLRGVLKPSLD